MKVIALIIFLGLAGIASAQNWRNFDHKDVLFTASYPSNWINKTKETGRVFFTSPAESETDDFFENINVGVSTNPEFGVQVKIKDAVPELQKVLRNAVTSFKQEKLRYFTWNATDAIEIVYSGYSTGNDKLKIRITQWFCFYKTRLYTVTYTAEATKDVHSATALKIMGSIKFK